jgi:hypothetical protein
MSCVDCIEEIIRSITSVADIANAIIWHRLFIFILICMIPRILIKDNGNWRWDDRPGILQRLENDYRERWDF